jgi:hypothetical protein
MAGAKVPLSFRIFKGDQLLREEKLSLSVIKIGKVSSAHLKLDDETVSRMHAIIEVNGPGDVSIIDLGSTKGTFVNGQKVNKAKLQSGDTIVVGDTRIELAIGADEEEEIPTRVQAGVSAGDSAGIIASTPRPPAAAPPPAPMAAMAPPAPAPMAPMAPPAPMAAPMAAAMMAPPAAAMAPPAPAFRAPPGMPGMAPFGAAALPQANFQAAMSESIDDHGGARAVEVAAMLGDSVVGVKHCMDPRSGKTSAATYGFFAAGVLTLLLAAGGFFISVDNAAYNKAKLDNWTNVQKKPARAFRPRELSPAYDALTFGGIAIALFSLTYGLIRYRNEKKSPFFRIGTAPGVEFSTEGAPSPDFPLIAPHGDDFVFNYGHGMEGELVLDGQSTSLADLAGSGRARPSTSAPGAIEISIPPKARIRVRAGKATFLVSAVAQPRRQAMPLFAAMESMVLLYFVGSLFVHLGIVLLLNLVPVDDGTAGLDVASIEDTSTRTNSSSNEDPPPPPPEDKQDDGKDESGGTGTAMALDEGKMGKKDSDRAEGQYKMKKESDNPEIARQQAIEQARSAGILGSSALTQGGAFASLTGTGDISSGFDDSNIYGGLLGNEAGEMNGGFGFGRSGFGPGGGGTGWGTIGTGRYGTIGHGNGTGSGYGVGGGRGGMRGRSSAVPTVSIGQPNSQGDLDKAIIRRYIKRNIQKITYCYEKQLLAKPALAGTVATQFFITPNGTVASSTGSGVDPEVASCVADVIKGIEFPKPKGGGGVQVNYPFTFRPAGQ